MVDTNLVGKCGIYCGACGVYRADKDDGEFLKKLALEFKCPPGKVKCNGCGALTETCWGNDCQIVQCLRTQGFKFCYECGNYRSDSCEKFGKLAQRYLKIGVDVRKNLERIKRGETEAWLRESEQRFKCPSCARPVPVYGTEGKCHHCGAELPESF